jgi:hypothetical protein
MTFIRLIISFLCFELLKADSAVNCSTIVAYDLFGDGWGDNLYLRVSTRGDFVLEGTIYDPIADLSNITTKDFNTSCVCTEITVCSQSAEFNVSVYVVEDSLVREPWEIYWEYVDVFDQVWIGDIDSSIGIDNNQVAWSVDMVDFDYDSEENECDTCPHKPKPPKKDDDSKGKDDEKEGSDKDSKPKPPPPAKVLIQLFDSDNDGWYDDVANWTNPCDIGSDLMFPNVLSYPRYYISNDDRTKLIHSGSLCLHDDKEICEEILPHEGDFVYRVAGFDQGNNLTWDFCGVKGTLGQELEFSMQGGKCVAGALMSASEICDGVVSVASISGELLLSGLFNDKLTEHDTLLLEHMISSTLNGDNLRITSWLVKRDVGLYVDFTLTMEMEQLGYEGIYSDMRSAFYDDVFDKLTTASTQGYMLNFLTAELSASSLTQRESLSAVNAIDIVKFEVTSITYSNGQTVAKEEVVAEPVEITTSSHKKDMETLNYGYGAMAFAAVIVGGAFAIFVVSRVMRKKPYQSLPESSEHASRM